jgi:uncharacterized membrane protein
VRVEPTPRTPPRRSGSGPALEELLGGRVLAWLGGVAVLLGVAFFVAVAISRGWIDEPTRVLLAFLGSTALLGTGVWLHERRGATQASRAMVASAVASLYLVLTAATQLYHLVPIAPALAGALAIGGVASAIAVRWDSRLVGGLGIVGALMAPPLVGAGSTGLAIGFVAVALASAGAVVVWRRWKWLSIAAFMVSVPQLADWALEPAPTGALLIVPVVFWALYAGLAIGYEARVPAAGLRASSAVLLLLAGTVVGGVAYGALQRAGHPALAQADLAGLAAAHLLLGVAVLRSRRVARPIGLLLIAGGIALGDTAYGLAVDGPGVAVGWAVGAVVLGVAGRVSRHDVELVRLGVGAQLVLAIGHTLLFDATPGQLVDGGGDLAGGLAALGAVGAVGFLWARLADDDRAARVVGDAAAMAALAYATAFALAGVALSAVWAGEAIALAAIARRDDDDVARSGAVAFLGLALAHALALEAPPVGLVDGVGNLGNAAGALVAVAVASAAVGRSAPRGRSWWRVAGEAGVLAVGLYLASIAVVTAFQPDGGAAAGTIAGLGVRQQGQVLVSALWALAGVGVLVWGLVLGDRPRRLAGLALLVAAVTKVFTYDLSELESLYRVLSLVGCGVLLLVGAYAYQRIRPHRARGG